MNKFERVLGSRGGGGGGPCMVRPGKGMSCDQ